MELVVTSKNQYNPPRWNEVEAHIQSAYLVFKSAGDVNRFRARYRLARAFQGVSLDGYSEATVRGYSSLMRMSLAWSALESLLLAMRISKHDLGNLARKHDFTNLLSELRNVPDANKFFRFVKVRLENKSQAAEVERFIDGRSCNGVTLAKAVRHIFLHGTLTPGARQVSPEVAPEVCDRLSQMLLMVMDDEFSEKADELLVALSKAKKSVNDLPF